MEYSHKQKSQFIFGGIIDLHEATAHVFRHTIGTLLNDIGADVKTIQSILGQSDFKTTMDRYVHPRDNKKQEAIQKVSSLLQE
ncbi:MAG: tyrosine-type recombinase/integrase [Clostridiales bacterium]|nr:tyrosine-type recombinase/integrase [Clostridiales bacterium]